MEDSKWVINPKIKAFAGKIFNHSRPLVSEFLNLTGQRIGEGDLAVINNVIIGEQCPRKFNLDFSECYLSKNDIKLIALALSKAKEKIEFTLGFAKNNFDDEDLRTILDSLHACRYQKSLQLNFSYNAITDEGLSSSIATIIQAISCCYRLYGNTGSLTINFYGNPAISNPGEKAVIDSLKQKPVPNCAFYFSRVALVSDEYDKWAFLSHADNYGFVNKNNPLMTPIEAAKKLKFELPFYFLTQEEIRKKLSQGINGMLINQPNLSQPVTLNFFGLNYQDRDIDEFIMIVSQGRFKKLTISFENNQIGNTGLILLITSLLAICESELTVSVVNNEVTDAGLEELLQLLDQNSQLTLKVEIDMRDNKHIKKTSAEAANNLALNSAGRFVVRIGDKKPDTKLTHALQLAQSNELIFYVNSLLSNLQPIALFMEVHKTQDIESFQYVLQSEKYAENSQFSLTQIDESDIDQKVVPMLEELLKKGSCPLSLSLYLKTKINKDIDLTNYEMKGVLAPKLALAWKTYQNRCARYTALVLIQGVNNRAPIFMLLPELLSLICSYVEETLKAYVEHFQVNMKSYIRLNPEAHVAPVKTFTFFKPPPSKSKEQTNTVVVSVPEPGSNFKPTYRV